MVANRKFMHIFRLKIAVTLKAVALMIIVSMLYAIKNVNSFRVWKEFCTFAACNP